jgi:hypothetical protein
MIGPPLAAADAPIEDQDWKTMVGEAVVCSLPTSEVSRQRSVMFLLHISKLTEPHFHHSIIYRIITKEEQYIRDLDLVESNFIKPLRNANPPILPFDNLEEFIDEVFGNILDLRECNRHLLETLYVRQREQAPIIHGIGDIFLDAATEFRLAYPIYIGHFPITEKRMKDEIENNPAFRLFLEVREHCSYLYCLLYDDHPFSNVLESLLGKGKFSDLT